MIVLGGGPAGAAAAIALARAGRSVVVLEKSRYQRPRVGETLPPAARPLLAELAAWEPFLSAGHLRSPGVLSAWGDDELYQTHFIYHPYGPGWHLDRRRFDAMLAGTVRRAGARLYCGAQVASCSSFAADRWEVEFTSGIAARRQQHRLHARFLVDATGRAAVLARWQGSRRRHVDRLVGLAGVLVARPQERGGSADECDCCTLVEACADGWWYSALLPRGRLMAVYLTDADLLRRDHGSWRAIWHARLRETTHTQMRLRGFDLQADPRAVVANSSRLDHVSGRGWLAVGDAAMAFDPLSSRGLLQALASGIRAGEAIDRSLAGAAAASRAYAARANDEFREYSRLRALYYRREQRWPRSEFWQRRHAA